MVTDTSTYEATRQRHVADALARLGAQLERLEWTREQILAEQRARLRDVLAVAKERSPWHRQRLNSIDPAKVTIDGLRSPPVMTKADLMSNWDAIVTDSRLTLDAAEHHLANLRSDAYLFDEFHIVASGGSSGKRGVFAWDWEGWSLVYLGFTRWLLRAAMRTGALESSRTMAIVAAEMPTHMTSAVSQTFTNPATPTHRFPVTMPVEQIVGALNDLRPTVLSGYPSMLAELVREADAGRLVIAPRMIVSTSEPLVKDVRDALQRAWAVPVMNWWGTSEAGPTGSSCGFADGMHLAEDMMIVESVDDAYRPVAPGATASRVLLTNLINPLMPLIRYEITDEVTLLDEPCPCGSQFARVGDIQGRTDDCFVYEGGIVVHPHVLRSPLGRAREVIEYQVRQTPAGADIDVRCSSGADLGHLERDVAEHLQAVGLRNPAVNVRRVDEIARTAAGKVARFVPLRRSS